MTLINRCYFFFDGIISQVGRSGLKQGCLNILQKMKYNNKNVNKNRAIQLLAIFLLITIRTMAQQSSNGQLERMPVDLETDFALSALPSHLRQDATVYLMDPAKGFYIGRQGKNGFICFVSRTEWEWAEFRNDLAAPISFDAEGAKSIFPVYSDVAAMRASGQFTPAQIKDSVMDRIRKGFYKAPGRTGISYMLAPEMRVYPGKPDNNTVVTMSLPHYMIYAPYVMHEDLGLDPNAQEGPALLNPGQWLLGDRKGPFGYIIMISSEIEKTGIVEEGKELMKRLAEYKPYFKVETERGHH